MKYQRSKGNILYHEIMKTKDFSKLEELKKLNKKFYNHLIKQIF